MSYYDNASTPMFDHFSRPAEHHVTIESICTHRNEILLFFPQGCRIVTPIGTLVATPPVPKITPSGALHAESEWGWRVSDIIHSMRVNPNECNVTGTHYPPEDREPGGPISDRTPTCGCCGDPCDFGQRGDGPAEQDPSTGLYFCSETCFGAHLIEERRAENGLVV